MKDIDIARAATLLPIQEVAATLGIGADQLIPDGRAKAQLDLAALRDLPKRPEYDQHKLKEAVEALRKWGEDPDNYVGIEIKVSEAKYTAWPPGIRQLFEPARTLKTGKPVYKLEQVTAPNSQAATNDSNFGEVA